MFVGLSGIEVLDGGRLVAISDEADWIEAQLVLDDAAISPASPMSAPP